MSHDGGQQVNVDEEAREADMPRSPQVEVKAMVDYDQMDGTTPHEGSLHQRFVFCKDNDIVRKLIYFQMQNIS